MGSFRFEVYFCNLSKQPALNANSAIYGDGVSVFPGNRQLETRAPRAQLGD